MTNVATASIKSSEREPFELSSMSCFEYDSLRVRADKNTFVKARFI